VALTPPNQFLFNVFFWPPVNFITYNLHCAIYWILCIAEIFVEGIHPINEFPLGYFLEFEVLSMPNAFFASSDSALGFNWNAHKKAMFNCALSIAEM